ncbi:MAG: hypothetical protein ACYS7Y_04360 [Planctomycetota bacterium]|jgi:hypothetical protein
MAELYSFDNIRWGIIVLHVLLGIPAIFILRWEARHNLEQSNDGQWYHGWNRGYAIVVTLFAILLGPWMSGPVALVEFIRYLGRKGLWKVIANWFSQAGP